MLIPAWQEKLVASEPAALFPILAISIWFMWNLPAGFDRQDHWVARGILNILLGLYHNQEWFLLLAHTVRNLSVANTAQREVFLGVSLSQSEKLVERNFGSKYFYIPLLEKSGRKYYDREHTEADLLDVNPLGQPTFLHFKTLILIINLLY